MYEDVRRFVGRDPMTEREFEILEFFKHGALIVSVEQRQREAKLRQLKKELRMLRRSTRAHRLYFITSAYNHFTKMRLYSSAAKSENSYEQAESFADLGNFLFGKKGVEAKPADFLHDRNEMTDKAISEYEKYRDILNVIDTIDGMDMEAEIDRKSIEAFCRHVEYGHKPVMLKTLGHVQYPRILGAYALYALGKIDISELQPHLVWLGFSMEMEPLNIRKFARQMIEIENIHGEIRQKQVFRLKNKSVINNK
jgi:hypothetical protein